MYFAVSIWASAPHTLADFLTQSRNLVITLKKKTLKNELARYKNKKQKKKTMALRIKNRKSKNHLRFAKTQSFYD